MSEPALRPRVWTVFTVYSFAFAAMLAIQIVVLVAIVVLQAVRAAGEGGPDPSFDPGGAMDGVLDTISNPGVFIGLGLLAEAAIGLSAAIPARMSPRPFLERLGLHRPGLPPAGYALVMAGSLVPLAIGVGCAIWLANYIDPDPTIEALYAKMTWGWALPMLLFISLAPGLAEEALFRGYIQRRLLERWSPWAAIIITSVLFAVIHVNPHAIVAAFWPSLWFGVIAWRAGSIWPAVACHAFINGAWNVWQLGHRLAGWPEWPPPAGLVALGTAAVACFVLSIPVLRSPGGAR